MFFKNPYCVRSVNMFAFDRSLTLLTYLPYLFIHGKIFSITLHLIKITTLFYKIAVWEPD